MQTSPPHTLHHPWRSSFPSRWGMCDLNTHTHTHTHTLKTKLNIISEVPLLSNVLLKEFHWFVKLTGVKVCTCVCRRIVIGWLHAPKREDSDVIRTNTTLTVSAVVSQWLLNFQNKPTCLHPTHPSEAPDTIVVSTLLFFLLVSLKLDVDCVPTERQRCYGCGHMVLIKQTVNRLYWLMDGK